RSNGHDLSALPCLHTDPAQARPIGAPRTGRTDYYNLHIGHFPALVRCHLAVLAGDEIHPIPLALFTFCLAWLWACCRRCVYATSKLSEWLAKPPAPLPLVNLTATDLGGAREYVLHLGNDADRSPRNYERAGRQASRFAGS